jgi:hypothetical protein
MTKKSKKKIRQKKNEHVSNKDENTEQGKQIVFNLYTKFLVIYNKYLLLY